VACAQSFTLWQQATTEFTRHDHSMIACSRHIYVVLFFAHIPFVVNREFSATPAAWLQRYHEQSNVTNCVDSFASCGCISLINKPSRFSKNSTPTLLDHIYTNICDEQRINNAGITIFDISDPLPVFVNFNLHQRTPNFLDAGPNSRP